MAFHLLGHTDGKHSRKIKNSSDVVNQEPMCTTIYCNPCRMVGTVNAANGFCTSCFDFMCRTCKVKHQQSYTDHSVITNDLGRCGAYIDLSKEISLAKQELVQTHNEAEENIRLADRYRDNALEAIKEERENINKMLEEKMANFNKELDDLEATVRDTITKKYTEDNDKFQAIIKDTKSLKTDLEKITPNSNIQQPTTNENVFFETMAVSQQELTMMKPRVREVGAHNEVTKYRFAPQWQQHFTRMAITKLGAIQILDSNKANAAINTLPDINARSSVDTESCSIKGMCLLSKHFLVVADSQNKSVKVLERENYEVVSAVAMPTGPGDMTKVKDNQIAVTLPNSNLIQVLNKTNSNSLSRSHDIKVDGRLRGIVHNNGKLVVSFDFPTSYIQILDMNGNLLQKFDSSHTVESLKGKSSYAGIGVSPDHKMIYVADKDQETVTCMTMQGRVTAIYRNKHLLKPHALTVDSNGLVYVSGKAKVHELSPDLGHGRIILDHSHGIQYIHSLVYCNHKKALYVGMLQQDKIKAFEIL